MVNYTVEAYDAIDYICMDGHLNEEGYIMCLYQYHYVQVMKNLNTLDDYSQVSY